MFDLFDTEVFSLVHLSFSPKCVYELVDPTSDTRTATHWLHSITRTRKVL